MVIHFTNEALKDLKYWKKVKNTQIQKRISLLLDDLSKHPFKGLGNPERLKHQLSSCWSRRIDKEHRLVYKVLDNQIDILSLRFHY